MCLPTAEQARTGEIPDDFSNEWPEVPDVDGDIFDVTDDPEEESGDDLEASDIVLDPSVIYGVEQGEELEDEDAIREEAAAMGFHDVSDEFCSDEEDADSVDMEVGEGAGGAMGGQGDDLTMEPAPPEVDPQHEGWVYWVGWLASRYRYRYRELDLGEPTSQYTTSGRGGRAPPIWINSISQGGLTVPSDSFLSMIESFEVVFKSIHGEELSYEKGAIDRVVNKIRDLYPDKPLPIVKSYARGRFYLRLRYLNFCRREIIAQEKLSKKLAKEAKQAALQGAEPSQSESGQQEPAPTGPTQSEPQDPADPQRLGNMSTSADRRQRRKNQEWRSMGGGKK